MDNRGMSKNALLHLARHLPCVFIIVMTCVLALGETSRGEGFFHWKHSRSASRRGLGDLLQSAESDVAKSLFASARAGTAHICGSLSGGEEMCVAFNIFLYIAGAIVGVLLLSLLLFIAVVLKAGAPRLASAAVLCHQVGLALVVVGFAFTMGMYKVGQQLQQALGGQMKAGVAVMGGSCTFGVAVLCLAVDMYCSYRRRKSLPLREDRDLCADEVGPT